MMHSPPDAPWDGVTARSRESAILRYRLALGINAANDWFVIKSWPDRCANTVLIFLFVLY